MNEGIPGNKRPYQSELQKATLEGNIAVPQIPLGIVLHGVEHCFMAENPRTAMDELVAPIPLDENLTRRTAKVNAQHALHKIPLVLGEGQIRSIQAQGNLTMLWLIGGILGNQVNLNYHIYFEKDGAWANPETKIFLSEIKEKLTPERIAFLRFLFSEMVKMLKNSDIVSKLKERKDLLSKAVHQAERDQMATKGEAMQITDSVVEKIDETLSSFSERRTLSEDENKMLARFEPLLAEISR